MVLVAVNKIIAYLKKRNVNLKSKIIIIPSITTIIIIIFMNIK